MPENENKVSTFKTLNICLKGMLSVTPKYRTAELTQAISICRRQIQNSLKINCSTTARKDIKPFSGYNNNINDTNDKSHSSLLSAAILSASNSNQAKTLDSEEKEKKIISITFPSNDNGSRLENGQTSSKSITSSGSVSSNKKTISIPVAIPKMKHSESLISTITSLTNSLNHGNDLLTDNTDSSNVSFPSFQNYDSSNQKSIYQPSSYIPSSPLIKTTTNYNRINPPSIPYPHSSSNTSTTINVNNSFWNNSNINSNNTLQNTNQYYTRNNNSSVNNYNNEKINLNNSTINQNPIFNNNDNIYINENMYNRTAHNHSFNKNVYKINNNNNINGVQGIGKKNTLKRSKSLPNIIYFNDPSDGENEYELYLSSSTKPNPLIQSKSHTLSTTTLNKKNAFSSSLRIPDLTHENTIEYSTEKPLKNSK